MKFTDILELAKQGYKPSDIKELLSLETTEKDEDQPKDSNKGAAEETKETCQDNPEQQTEADNTEKDASPDYKKLYEESQKELQKLQSANNKKDVSGDKPDPDDTLNEWARSFM